MTDPQARQQRTLWLQPLLAIARLEGPIPRYGSPAWIELDGDQWRKYVAPMLAGEHYARLEEDAPRHLEDEIAAQMWVDETEAAQLHHQVYEIVQRHARIAPYRERGIPRRAA